MDMALHDKKILSFRINSKYKEGQTVFVKSVASLGRKGTLVKERIQNIIGKEAVIKYYLGDFVMLQIGNYTLLLKEAELSTQPKLF